LGCLLKIKSTNQPLYQPNTTNDSRNTKLQHYKQQSLPVQISVLLQLLILTNKETNIKRQALWI